MSNIAIDYGPLAGLIGVWKGDKGLDIAPEPDGSEEHPYFETISYQGIGDVQNAEKQTLAVVRYQQIVQKKADNTIFHDETGYWMWDAEQNMVMHSLTIPRAVCVLAGGVYQSKVGPEIVLEVEAVLGSQDWGIVQSPFMRDHAKTTKFQHQLKINGHQLSYFETTYLEIYGRSFEHTDQNELTLVSSN